MQGVYQAKHAFRGSIAGPARSTPSSPRAERQPQPQQCVTAPSVARLSARLGKCNSEPSVYEGPGAAPGDGMPASVTVLPSRDQHQIVLSFEPGDLFQVLSTEERQHWWAVRCLRSGNVGFVPANYLEPGDAPSPGDTPPLAQDDNCALLYELRSRVAAGAVFPATMIPEPDMCTPGGDLEKRNRRNTSGAPVAPPLPPFSPEGLIVPRKLVNPCLESSGHKNLHRELLFNHKIGKNVLNQKSELQKALEKHKDMQVKKEIQQQKESSKSALERVIEERARRLEMMQKPEEEAKSPNGAPEFLQVHAKLRARMDSK